MAINQSTKQSIVSSLCKHFALDPKPFLDKAVESNIKDFCLDILKASGRGAPQESNEEVMKWIAFAESCLLNAEGCVGTLNKLNEELITKSVLLGNGLKPSEADVIVFSVVQSSLVGTSNEERNKLPHLLRWMDYIQSKEDFGELFEKVALEKVAFDFQRVQPGKIAAKVDDASTKKKEADPKANTKETVQFTSSMKKPEADASAQKTEVMKKGKAEKDVKQEKKKKQPEAEPAADKDKEVSVSLLNIQVGLICKAWKHPSADSLLVEEINVGEAKPRQVVSGLAKYCTPEALTNRRVVLITNVKPGKLRDVMSEGLVLCASNEDHSVVEPLLPPEGANVGERVSFAGYGGKPEDVLNPKKKQLEKITPHLFTDEKGVATFKGVPFMTSGGPCNSSIPKATIK